MIDRRTAATVLTAGLLVLGVAGCGDSGTAGSGSGSVSSATVTDSTSPDPEASASEPPSASPSASGTATDTASGTATGTATSTASGSASGTGTTAECTSSEVAFSLTDPEGAAGSTYYRLVMTNTSQHPCRTRGYGGVSLVGHGDGTQIGAAADRVQHGKVTSIRLAPGAHARATLQVSEAGSYSRSRCRPRAADGLRIYPPDETHARFLKAGGLTGCRSGKVHLLSLAPYQPAG